jgi:hypothetical protein
MDAYLATGSGLLAVHDLAGERAVTEYDVLDPECVAFPGGRALVGTFDEGLWRATDDGLERVAPETLPSRVTALAAAPSDPATVYLGSEPSDLYRSTDGGATWTACPPLTDLPSSDEWSFPPRPETHHVRCIAVHPESPGHVAVGIEAGAFLLSDDGGDSWTERPPGSRRDNHALAVHPAAPDRLYAAAGDGYAESTDAGASWRHPQTGLDHRYVWGLAVDPADPDRVYVSAASGAYRAHRVENADAHVYRRDGEDWVRFDGDALGRGIPTGEGVCRAVLAAPAPGELLAATNRGLFRSTDAGASFEQLLTTDGTVPAALTVRE